jgi:hypothetical protein
MTVGRAAAMVAGVLLLGAATFALSQESEPDFSHLRPVNLRVLPRDISASELGKRMKGYEADLGVTCSHCHVQDSATRKFDYASDENPDKATARLMIAMLKDINDKYLAELGGDRRYTVPVTCGSCHQGQSSPPPFEASRP